MKDKQGSKFISSPLFIISFVKYPNDKMAADNSAGGGSETCRGSGSYSGPDVFCEEPVLHISASQDYERRVNKASVRRQDGGPTIYQLRSVETSISGAGH